MYTQLLQHIKLTPHKDSGYRLFTFLFITFSLHLSHALLLVDISGVDCIYNGWVLSR